MRVLIAALLSLPILTVATGDYRKQPDGIHGRIPPVFGALLGPQRPLHAHILMRRGVPRAHVAALIHQERARTASADIDAQPHRNNMVSQPGGCPPAARTHGPTPFGLPLANARGSVTLAQSMRPGRSRDRQGAVCSAPHSDPFIQPRSAG